MATLDLSLWVFAINDPSLPYHIGDIVDVSEMHGDECSHARFVLVHVTDIPLPAQKFAVLKRIKEMLENQPSDDTFEVDPLRKRQWRVKVGQLPNAVREALLTDREYTVTWSVAKNYIGKRIISNASDPDSDTDFLITDEDI